MSDRSDDSEAADESSSDDDAACRGEPKDRGVLGPLRGGGPSAVPGGGGATRRRRAICACAYAAEEGVVPVHRRFRVFYG